MKLVLTASGWGQDAEEFADSVREFIINSSKLKTENFLVTPIKWQIDLGPQKLVDFFDARSGKKVIIKIAQKLVEELNIADENNIDTFILSYSTGSRLIEESLSSIKGLNGLNINIEHIMIAPAINGAELASIGKYASSALALGLGGLIAAKTKGKTRLASALLGVLGGLKLLRRDTVMDKLSVASEDNNLQLAKIKRHIFFSPTDEKIRDIPKDIPNTDYYSGSYSHSELGDLSTKASSQIYQHKSWFREQESTKGKLLANILG